MQTILEPERAVPVAGEWDVLVCGGGPAGVAAALRAARRGARTALLEVQGCLGGIWTSGLLSYVLDAGNKTGLMPELIAKLASLSGGQTRFDEAHELPWVKGSFFFEPEMMKWALEELCAAAGVSVQLHTRVTAAYTAGRRLEAVVSESKSGRQAWRARAFVDASGDGDLGALAGCAFELGHPLGGQVQPMSLLGLLCGVAPGQVQPFINGLKGEAGSASAQLLAEIERSGFSPSYRSPVLFQLSGDLYALMANQEYSWSALDAAQVSAATFHARRELNELVRSLRGLGSPWENLRLVATPNQIGTREGRRILGRYQVSSADLLAGARHADAVCRVTFPVDVHSIDPARGKGYGDEGVRSQPYDIPLRALFARDVDGLLLAGRCISGDFFAHASYRVTGNAVALGEAAGSAAAAAALRGCLPHEVSFAELA